MRWIIGLLLVAHGLIHVAIWLAPATDDAPFDVRHSPWLGDLGAAATVTGVSAGALLLLAGSAYLLAVSWWPAAVTSAVTVSTALLVMTFTPWWLLALALNLALGVFAVSNLETA